MEAKDTVMSDEQIAQYMNTPEAHAGGDDCYWDLDGIVQAQAEISFKAGIREVVDFAEETCPLIKDMVRWQAKLKEWNIKEVYYR